MRLGELLIRHEGVAAEAVDAALEGQLERYSLLGELLVAAKALDEVALARGLARQAGCAFRAQIDADAIPDELLDLVPLPFARGRAVLPLHQGDDGAVSVVLADPFDLTTLSDLRLMIQRPLVTEVASPAVITSAANSAYDRATRLAEDAAEGLEESHAEDEEEFAIQDILDAEDEAPIIRFVHSILSQAVRERASDIHVEPYERELAVRFRVDGVLREVVRPPKAAQSSIISRIKVMAGLNIAEKRLPQDGRIRLKRAGRDIDIRVSTIPTSHGERVVMRLLDRAAVLKPLESLGFTGQVMSGMERLIRRSHGIILVTGPTGSGKTTTLYGCLSKINSPDKNILTIEDPVEYQLPGVGQVPVNPKIELTFASGLRAFLRQDPDVIMVGEIRDVETAEIAIQASLTGHLVLSTIHTNDAASAMTRLVDMGVETFLVASSLAGVLAQRLVRTVCADCAVTKPLSEAACRELGVNATRHVGSPVRQGRGCPTCQHTGYRGRTGIYELLFVDDVIRDLVLANADSARVKRAAREAGMISLRQDGFRKVLAGQTSVAEVCRVTTEEAVLD
jgi:general secretion pathway protein E